MPSMLMPAHRRGRPPKFGRPAQAVTITLPDDIVASLKAFGGDLSRAIVQLAETAAPCVAPRPPVELVHYGRHAVIVVTPTKALTRLPGVSLVPLPDGRALISLDAESGVAELEVRVRDAVDTGSVATAERAVLMSLSEILRMARQSRDVTLSERNIIVLESRRTHKNGTARRSGPRGGLQS